MWRLSVDSVAWWMAGLVFGCFALAVVIAWRAGR